MLKKLKNNLNTLSKKCYTSVIVYYSLGIYSFLSCLQVWFAASRQRQVVYYFSCPFEATKITGIKMKHKSFEK